MEIAGVGVEYGGLAGYGLHNFGMTVSDVADIVDTIEKSAPRLIVQPGTSAPDYFKRVLVAQAQRRTQQATPLQLKISRATEVEALRRQLQNPIGIGKVKISTKVR